MDKIQAWVKDRKNMPIMVAGVVVLLVIIFVVVKLTGNKSAGQQSPAGYSATGGPPGLAGPGMGGMPEGPGGPGMSGGLGMPGAVAAAAPAAPAAQPSALTEPMLPYRKDPFVPFDGEVTKEKALAYVVPTLAHYDFPVPAAFGAPKPVEEQAPEVLPPQPFRRMAGVLMDGQISAIMETAGSTQIVWPGMEIDKGGSRVRVQAITPDEIILDTLDTKTPMTIRVGMFGPVTLPPPAPPPSAAGGYGQYGPMNRGGAGGYPGGPGMGPGGLGPGRGGGPGMMPGAMQGEPANAY